MGALAIIPLIACGSLQFNVIRSVQAPDHDRSELIVLPLAVSRLLIQKGVKDRIEPYRGTLTNWSFFVVLYAMVGLNRDGILGQPLTLLPVAAICDRHHRSFLGFLIDWVLGLFHIPKETRTSLVLLGTLKNQGMAGGLAMTLFSQEAALPAAVSTMVMICYIIWLDFKKRWE